MTKQEQIREGIATIIHKEGGDMHKTLDGIMAFLHSQDVVIKSDKEVLTMEELIMYGTVEPLIEEVKDGNRA